MNETDLKLLRLAISIALQAREHGNHPFGAVLADADGNVLMSAENTVETSRDCTGHAETNLVRLACGAFTADQLATCSLYSSTEPCAMCSGAIHWSGIRRVVFALSEVALYDIVGPSPEHLYLSCADVFSHTQRGVEVVGPCVELDHEAHTVHAGFWK